MKSIQLRGNPEPINPGKILCIGRNYAEHAREMKAELPENPVVFLKPPSALISSGENVIIPRISHDVHHEVELVILIGKGGKNIPRSTALEHVAGYAVGLDMTLRDVQAEAKKKGLPWTVAKGFDTSAPVSTFVPRTSIPNPHALEITLQVNGKERQHGNTADMLFPIDLLIHYLSSIFTLEAGDLIFTGTPPGVGPVLPGDHLEAAIASIGTLSIAVQQEE